jgi:hypothetical protein
MMPGPWSLSELDSIGLRFYLARPLPAGFVPPCLPSGSKTPPSGKEWLHEIKHDGFRVIARKVGTRVKLYSRPGNDLTYRFSLIAVLKLRAGSCIIDGEAVACGADGKQGLALHLGTIAALDQVEEPASAGSAARGRGGLGQMAEKGKAFESITLGHSHGCRDLLIYCEAMNCNQGTAEPSR